MTAMKQRSTRFAVAVAASGCGFAALAQQTPPAPMPSQPEVKIETIDVSPGIYMLMLVGRGAGNVGVTLGKDGAAIIDDQFDDIAPKIRAAVTMLSEKPVSFVINTHLHGDHTGGNDAFGRSGAVIIAHENVRKRLASPQVNPSTNQTTAARAREALPVVTFANSATLHFNDDEQVAHVQDVGFAKADHDVGLGVRVRQMPERQVVIIEMQRGRVGEGDHRQCLARPGLDGRVGGWIHLRGAEPLAHIFLRDDHRA